MFSLQLQSQELQLTAAGLFQFDHSICFSVSKRLKNQWHETLIQLSLQLIGTIAGYLLVLIQFQLSKSRDSFREDDSVLKSV